MLRDGQALGAITFSRSIRGGYNDAEISLLQTFCNQAAIAIDNARLLTEIEQRNSELGESLELQTATSDILRLISANPGDLTTVLRGIAERAATLCDAEIGSVLLRHGDILRIEAESASMNGMQSLVGREFIADRTINRRARDSREPVFLDDFQDVRDSVGIQVAQDLPDLHSFATIALLLDGEWIGSLNLSRTEVRPFDPKVAPIMQAFADQAAIAVANAKLFNDLDAALERQTAMTDVLDAVSTARTDLQPVYDAVAAPCTASLSRGHRGALRQAGREPRRCRRRRAAPPPLRRSGGGPRVPDRARLAGRRGHPDVRGLSHRPAGAHPRLGRRTAGRLPGHRHAQRRTTERPVAAAAAEPRSRGCDQHLEGRTRRLQRRRDVTAPGVREPGRHRCRQRTTSPRNRGAQPGSVGVARTPDCDERGAAAHQRQPGRSHGGPRGHHQPRGCAVRRRDRPPLAQACRRTHVRGRASQTRRGVVRRVDVFDAREKTVYSISARRRQPMFNDDVLPLVQGTTPRGPDRQERCAVDRDDSALPRRRMDREHQPRPPSRSVRSTRSRPRSSRPSPTRPPSRSPTPSSSTTSTPPSNVRPP